MKNNAGGHFGLVGGKVTARHQNDTPEGAEIIAFEVLAFLAGDPERLERFLAASGADSEVLRDIAGNRDLLVAILDFLLSDEALLLEFCDAEGTRPRDVHLARYRLGGE